MHQLVWSLSSILNHVNLCCRSVHIWPYGKLPSECQKLDIFVKKIVIFSIKLPLAILWKNDNFWQFFYIQMLIFRRFRYTNTYLYIAGWKYTAVQTTEVRVGHTLGQISPKWYISGTCTFLSSVWPKCTETDLKKSQISRIKANVRKFVSHRELRGGHSVCMCCAQAAVCMSLDNSIVSSS